MLRLIRRAFVLALLTTSLTAGVAFAGQPSSHLTITPFTASYDNSPYGGFFTCAGERIASTGKVTFTEDLEVCAITDVATIGFPPGVYPIIPSGGSGKGFAFYSDYDGQRAVSGTVVIIGYKNGTGTLLIEANF